MAKFVRELHLAAGVREQAPNDNNNILLIIQVQMKVISNKEIATFAQISA